MARRECIQDFRPKLCSPLSWIFYEYEDQWQHPAQHQNNLPLLRSQLDLLTQIQKEVIRSCHVAESALHFAVYSTLALVVIMTGFLIILHARVKPIPMDLVQPIWYFITCVCVCIILWKIWNWLRYIVELQVVELHIWERCHYLDIIIGDCPINRIGVSLGQCIYVIVYVVLVICAFLTPILGNWVHSDFLRER